jgi:hypothetical protein
VVLLRVPENTKHTLAQKRSLRFLFVVAFFFFARALFCFLLSYTTLPLLSFFALSLLSSLGNGIAADLAFTRALAHCIDHCRDFTTSLWFSISSLQIVSCSLSSAVLLFFLNLVEAHFSSSSCCVVLQTSRVWWPPHRCWRAPAHTTCSSSRTPSVAHSCRLRSARR